MPASSRRGFIIIYTGHGKGKTSAALGAVFRALGHGWRVLVIQFFKGDWPIVFGELELAKRLAPQLEVLQVGKGFVKHMGDKKPFDEHLSAAQEALHLILTGRDAPQALIDRADLVTEMTEVKHPWQQKIPAQAGIDY